MNGAKLKLGILLSGLFLTPALAQYGINGELHYKPNFLFILSDDLSAHAVGALGNPVIKTPTIDSLAHSGMKFTNAYNQGGHGGGVCTYSRYMLNTGMYYQPGITTLDVPVDASKPFWGKVLQGLGYVTYEAGKWHNGTACATNSFTKSVRTGHCACGGSSPGDPYHRPYGNGGTAAAPKPGGNTWSPTNTSDGQYASDYNFGTGKHSSEAITDKAIGYLNEHVNGAATKSKPFFIYVSYNAPHDFRQAPKKFQDMYPYASIDITPNYMPKHPFDNGEMQVRDEKLASFPRDSVTYRLHRSEYYAIISHMDGQMRRLLDALDASGKRDSTFVIFTSDHGLAVGEHGLVGKQNLYEHSTKVPFFIDGPGIAKNGESDALMYYQSINPTVVELAGGTVGSYVQFPSAKNLLNKSETQGLDDLYYRYVNIQRAIRTPYYKLIMYLVRDPNHPVNDESTPGSNRVQLFRMKSASTLHSKFDSADVWETRDLSGDPAYASVLSGHLHLLDKRMKEIGGALPFPDSIANLMLAAEASSLVLPKDTAFSASIGRHARPTLLDFTNVSRIEVYSMEGVLLTTISPSARSSKNFHWDGWVNGQKVPKGVYLLKYIASGNSSFIRNAFVE